MDAEGSVPRAWRRERRGPASEDLMGPVVKNILAVVGGLVAGSVVNMTIVMAGNALVPPPAGMDPQDPASIAAHMHLFGPLNFAVPWLAHALGTLAGAALAARLAATRPFALALGIGGFFLLGGIAASMMIPAPWWFIALDLLAAYLPMAWLGQRLGAPKASA